MKITKKNFIANVVVFALLILFFCMAIRQYKGFQMKAREKECLTYLNSFYVAAKASEAEHSFLPDTEIDIEFNPVMTTESICKFYTFSEDIPIDVLKTVPEHFRPFRNKKNYRVLTILKNDYTDSYSLWKLEPNKTIQNIVVDIPKEN